MTESEFLDCLRPKYAAPEYVLLPQVRNSTGFARRVRTADALAVSLWPSRGIGAEGFEFKDSRTDWLKELKDGAKAEEIGRFCTRWWIVVSDPKVVAKGELPGAWGLLHATGDAVKVIDPAPLRDAQEPSWTFVAAVLRAAAEVVTNEADVAKRVAKESNEAVQRAMAAAELRFKARQEQWDRANASLVKSVEVFEQTSGVRLDTWGQAAKNRRIGEAVKLVLAGGMAGLTGELARIADAASRLKQQAETVLAEGCGDGNEAGQDLPPLLQGQG